jgi:hypothetical protein
MVSLASHGISGSRKKYSCLSCKCLPCPRTSVHDVPGLYITKGEGEKAGLNYPLSTKGEGDKAGLNYPLSTKEEGDKAGLNYPLSTKGRGRKDGTELSPLPYGERVRVRGIP